MKNSDFEFEASQGPKTLKQMSNEVVNKRMKYDYEFQLKTSLDHEEESRCPGPSETETNDDNLGVKRSLRWAKVEVLESQNLFNCDTIKYLRDLNEFAFNHQEIGYHIRSFIEDAVIEDPDSYETIDKDQLKSDLSYLAFRDHVSEKAVEQIDDSILCSQNTSYWATNILENWVICDQIGSYKYSQSCEDTWSECSFLCLLQGKRSEKRLQIYNENTLEVNSGDFWDTEGGRMQYLFHGTDWDSVDSIVRNGIVLIGSCFGQDFSFRHRPGFYVSQTFESARVWARSKAACAAVIIFKVPVDLFSDRERHLHLRKEEGLLEKVYRYNRSRGERACEIQAATKDCLSITGPLLLNPADFLNNEASPIPSVDLQTCILDNAVASQLNSSITGVVYFKKKELIESEGRM